MDSTIEQQRQALRNEIHQLNGQLAMLVREPEKRIEQINLLCQQIAHKGNQIMQLDNIERQLWFHPNNSGLNREK